MRPMMCASPTEHVRFKDECSCNGVRCWRIGLLSKRGLINVRIYVCIFFYAGSELCSQPYYEPRHDRKKVCHIVRWKLTPFLID
jgi:hypothetical protein